MFIDLYTASLARIQVYPEHARTVAMTQVLRLPWVDDRVAQGRLYNPETDKEWHETYDEALSHTLSLFQPGRIQKLDILMDDGSTAYRQPNDENTLNVLRSFPLLDKAISATRNLLSSPSLTCLSLSGLRSKADHDLVVESLEQAVSLQELELEYHAEFTFPEQHTPSFVNADEDDDTVLDMKRLWTALGKLHNLRSLQILYYPQTNNLHDPTWAAPEWNPRLEAFACNEITGALLHQCIGDGGNLLFYMGCEEGIERIEATPGLSFPDVTEVEMFLDEKEYHEAFFKIFRKSPIRQLSMEALNLRSFVDLYIRDENRHPTLQTLVLRHGELHGEEALDPQIQGVNGDDVERFSKLGITLLLPEDPKETGSGSEAMLLPHPPFGG